MQYEALNPRGDVDPVHTIGLQPRVKNLNNITLGLYATFKIHWVQILDEIGRQLQHRYPKMKIARFQYTKDLNAYTQVAEVAKDPEVRPAFEKWLKGVDAVLTANGDAGSCTLYLTYNTTLVERLGKPVVMMLKDQYLDIFKRAAALRGVPAMRHVFLDIPDISDNKNIDHWMGGELSRRVAAVLDDIVAALTKPLTPEEKNPPKPPKALPRIVVKGNIQKVNDFFYDRGWSYGMPIVPPTEESVKEMLRGTDLPPDHVVAKIPLMNGKATVEKVAINAVMAGCRPTHMPVLIAAVEAMVDPRMWLEAYTCSVASWAPLLIVNGPIRNDLNINSAGGVFSPYYRANAAIGHTLGLLIMNIAGIQGGIDDKGWCGHEGRFGICIGENEEESPWEPLHQFYGFNKEESAVTLFFPNSRQFMFFGDDPAAMLQTLCDGLQPMGFDPGCAFIMAPSAARILHNYGMSRKDFRSYIVEYARRPAPEVNLRWMRGNNHLPKTVVLPAEPSRTVRKFFSDLHLPVVIAGMSYGNGIVAYGGGGDHGGPVTHKITLPKNWKKLVAEYKDNKPQYK
ncbi:MAG TPA: hypothetical protein VMT62_13555 [Syntrophorhabdaceae bacterium]|nr:hypothetical protein [Syntrophorhabdaceae bacterium]